MGKRKAIQRVALAAAVALGASACLSDSNSSGGGGNSGTKPGDKNVEIVFGFGGSQSKGFQQSLKGFETAVRHQDQIHRGVAVLRHPDPHSGAGQQRRPTSRCSRSRASSRTSSSRAR